MSFKIYLPKSFRTTAIVQNWEEILSRAYSVLLICNFPVFTGVASLAATVQLLVDCVVSFTSPPFFPFSVISLFVDHHMVLSILGHNNGDFFPLSDQIIKFTNWLWWQFFSIWHVSKRLGKCGFCVIQWWDWQSCEVRNGYSRFSCHVKSGGKSIIVCGLMRMEESALWYYILQLKSSDRNL